MGLFSPKKDNPPPSRSASDGSVLGKSRWFALHRNSKVFDGDASLTQHEVAFSSTRYIRPRGGSASQESDHRSSTDRATVTLAQRLNELAASNSDGLLGDEDYRLLRQNLFERFGAGSQLPTEFPVVKLSPPESSLVRGSRNIALSVDSSARSSRPPSVASNSSRVSTITSALRNALRRSSSYGGSVRDSHEDTHRDDISMASGPSGSFPRRLKHQSSIASIQSSLSSRPAMDARSVSSYKTGLSSRTGRTSTSKGPPSSYHRPRRLPRQPLELDGEESSAEIRAEISAVELEKQQLMENFQGLELSAVSQQGSGVKSISRSASQGERPSSMWTITPGTHTVSSRDPSPPPVPKLTTMKTMGPSVAERKRSLGVLNTASAKFSKSRDHIVTQPSIIQPASPAAKPPKSGFFRRRAQQSPPSDIPDRSTSSHQSVSESAIDVKVRPLPPTSSQSESSLVLDSHEANILANLRQRKAETAARYDQRLAFLRARLKGAELKERLI